jgi:hypothetical protein
MVKTSAAAAPNASTPNRTMTSPTCVGVRAFESAAVIDCKRSTRNVARSAATRAVRSSAYNRALSIATAA